MTQKAVIAVDIDEVLTPGLPGLITWHNLNYGTTLHLNDFYTYEFHKILGGDRDSAIAKCVLYFESSEPTQPFADAIRVLNRLKQDYELIVVTSRMLKHKLQTEAWINRFFPNVFKSVSVCNLWRQTGNNLPSIKKSTACLELGAKYLIDDLPHYIEDATLNGISGLLFGEYPWNQRIEACSYVELQTGKQWKITFIRNTPHPPTLHASTSPQGGKQFLELLRPPMPPLPPGRRDLRDHDYHRDHHQILRDCRRLDVHLHQALAL